MHECQNLYFLKKKKKKKKYYKMFPDENFTQNKY